MKPRPLAFLLALSLLAAAPMRAELESATIEVTEEPRLPGALVQGGLRKGRIVIAVAIDAEGRLSDWLVISASHEALIRPCTEALTQWRFKAARYNGEPVPVRLNLALEISQTGAVVSRTAIEAATRFIEELTGRRPDFQVCSPPELDRPLVARTRGDPPYALAVEQAGITGRVRVRFYVDEQGRVRLPVVPAEANPDLSAAAIEALRGWRFEPPPSRGRPAVVAVEQEFIFGAGRQCPDLPSRIAT